jgi:hypothetical protein
MVNVLFGCGLVLELIFSFSFAIFFVQVYGCLRSLNVQTVDQLAAYSAHDFAGPRGKMNMIQVFTR